MPDPRTTLFVGGNLTELRCRFLERGETVTTDPKSDHDIVVVVLRSLGDASRLVESYGLGIVALGYWTDPQEVADILNTGIADYVALPGADVIVARVRALRRRFDWSLRQNLAPCVPVIEGNGLRIDYDRREVKVDGEEVKLSPLEWRVLWFLAQSKLGLSREELHQRVWRSDTCLSNENNPRLYVRYLRQKLGASKIITDRRYLPFARYRLVLDAAS